MKYPKMQTLWKRDPENKFVITPGEFSREEFGNIKRWNYTEKIDGMNIRVIYEDDGCHDEYSDYPSFKGRTDKAILPKELLLFLERIFTPRKILRKFMDAQKVILFGEGYGAGIQKGGGLYRNAKEFILFDVLLDGMWLSRDSVEDIASFFGVEHVPEIKHITTMNAAIDYVKSRPLSLVSDSPKEMEGIVARSDPLLLFRNGDPLMWKLKLKDFDDLEGAW